MNPVHFSSERQDWATPQRFFDALDAEFRFTLDACATADNAKCPRFFSPADDALTQPWDGIVFCNPPYGHGIGRWVRKAHMEATFRHGTTVVALIPARTDTAWWHDDVMQATEIRLIRGRLRFSGHDVNAPFPCAVVVWTHGRMGRPRTTAMQRILDTDANA